VKSDRVHSTDTAFLRRRAEARLREQRPQTPPPSPQEALRLIHELQVHQIELEMQSESLRQTQAELAQSLELYSDLYDFAPVGYFTLDGDGAILDVNFAGAALMGLERFNLIGRRFALFVSVETRPRFNRLLSQSVRGASREHCEVTLVREGKPPCHAHLESAAANSGGGWRCRLVAVDITERKQAEEAHAVALAAAEHLARLKAEFANNTNHELRTPLSGILGLAYLGQETGNLSRAHQLFGKIWQEGQHLQRLIENILDFSSIEADQLTLAPVPGALAEIIDRAIEPTAAQARTKGLAFRDERAPDLPRFVLVDGSRLAQVLSYLLANAAKFTDRGHVAFSASRDGDWLVFRVADTGIGMSPDRFERSLQPFEQADGSMTRRFGGLGLQLALSRHLIDRMGGTIHAESAPDQGSLFTVRLPLIESPPAAAPEPAPARHLTGVKVLVADHHEINRWLLCAFLEKEGATVIAAETGQQTVERLQRDGDAACDLAFADLEMPGWDAHETARRIRELAPTVPVIGMASEIGPEIERRGAAVGAVDLLPISPLELSAVADKARRWARQR